MLDFVDSMFREIIEFVIFIYYFVSIFGQLKKCQKICTALFIIIWDIFSRTRNKTTKMQSFELSLKKKLPLLKMARSIKWVIFRYLSIKNEILHRSRH